MPDAHPNPIMAVLFFFIATSFYCIVSIFLTDSKQRFTARVCYILFVICGEYFINLNLTESLCGTRQWKPTLFITVIPWLMIFIVLQLFINMFPGWMTPFSNTFGYLVAKLMGLPDLMSSILTVDTNTPEVLRALENVRSDNALLINELYIEPKVIERDKDNIPFSVRKNFTKAWDKLVKGKIIREEFNSNQIEGKNKMEQLYYYVNMKYSIAEYVWNLLTGTLVTTISYNYIINTGCAKSPKEMKERYDKYEAEAADRQQQQKQQDQTNDITYVHT